jgi:hypothetical protein
VQQLLCQPSLGLQRPLLHAKYLLELDHLISQQQQQQQQQSL